MQIIRKIVATGLAALMAGASLAMPVMAATQLGNYPTFLAKDNALDAFVVVGASAASSDVVGAVDLAVRLAELSSVTKTVAGAGVAITGLDRDGIRIGGTANGRQLTEGGSVYSNPFPSGGLVKNIHFTGLKDSVITFRSNDYDYREQVDISGVRIRNDFGTSNVNGTMKMVVESGDVIYEYVFEKLVEGLGSISSPNYTYPVEFNMMGKKFSIVGTGASNSVKMLSGSTGTATATTSVDYGGYKVYAVIGSTNTLQMAVKDKDGNSVETIIFTGLATGTATTKTTTKTTPVLDITVTSFGTLTDGTVVGADLVIGPTGTTTKEYDASSDVTSTGSANDAFPGAARWGIQTSGFTTAGSIPANAKIQVVYKPESTLYLTAGEKVNLPNEYGDLKLVGFGTEKLATVTIEPENSGISTYVYGSDTLSNGTFKGIKISTDTPGTIVSTGSDTFDEAYVLFNTSLGTTQPNTPVMIGFKDKAKNKVIINGTVTNAAANTDYVNPNAYTTMNLGSSAYINGTLRYDFKLSYGGAGERDYYLNVTLQANTTNVIKSIRVGPSGSENVYLGFQNQTTAGSMSSAPEFRLGATASSSETTEVNATTEGTAYNVGKGTQTVVDDAGIQILNAESNGGSDKVKILVPSKELTARVYFGKEGAATGATTYKEIQPITSAVAKLDSEVGTAEKAKNLVLVGGPCVNTLVAELATAGKFNYTCANWPAENFALIKAVDDGFTTGKVALVVAGTRAADTRLATSVLQNYETKLKGQTASSVKVSGTSVATATITAA